LSFGGYYYWQYVYGNRELIPLMHYNRPKLKNPLQNFWANMHNFGECVKG